MQWLPFFLTLDPAFHSADIHAMLPSHSAVQLVFDVGCDQLHAQHLTMLGHRCASTGISN
jgi:hypothetical protein